MQALLHAAFPVFLLEAGAIVVLSRLLGVLARRFGQPMVVAEIAAGILLGPSFLGWVAPGVSRALFPQSAMSLLGLTSQIGLALFMFLIGLELDPKLLRGRMRSSVAISYSSILLPFALGALLALHVKDTLKPANVSMLAFVLFMGAAMSITAFPVLARILAERRLLRTRVGTVAIACAAVDDVTAWWMLAFVVSVARASSVASALVTVALAVAYIGAMLLGVHPLLTRLAGRTRIGLSQNFVAAVLVGVLASSLITEAIGIHALFGAFLFGAVFPKQGSLASALAEKVEDIIVVLLLPLFFAYSGLRTQIGLLTTPSAWVVCGEIALVACVGKFGGSVLAGRATGLPWREASAVGILMNTRGLMELVILNIGLDLGVISPALFAMMVIMALVTTFMTTPLLERVHPMDQLAKQLAEVSVRAVAKFTAIVCVSNEKSAPGLMAFGAALCGRGAEAASRLYVLHLARPADRASFILDQQRAAAAEGDGHDMLHPIAEQARQLEADVRPLSFVSDAPSQDICEAAEVKHADVVVLGWHKPLVGGAMLTGVVHEVMVAARCDVAVFFDRGFDRIASILVPFLGTEHDRAALRMAKRIAENVGARVTVLHVIAPSDADGRETREELEGGAVVFKTVKHAAPVEAAVEESREGYDLVIVGAGRQWGLEHRTFGPRAETILARTAVSLVVVRQGVAQRRPQADAPSEAAPPRPRYATLA